MARHDGGPAFPWGASVILDARGFEYARDNGNAGMTLRDWLAGEALRGSDWRGRLDTLKGQGYLPPQILSTIATENYDMADAMLAEREKREVAQDEVPALMVPYERWAEARNAANDYALSFLRRKGFTDAANTLESDLEIPF